VLLFVVLGVVALIVWGIVRSSKKGRERTNSLVEEARAELQVQIAAVANKLLEIADIVSASDTKKDDEHLRLASTTFTEIEESHRTIHDLRELEHLSDRLDEARWQLEAAEAIAYDRPVPPKPAPAERPVCFFDPAHTDATETAEIQTALGSRTVRVCKADADLLKRGQAPEPRMVTVGGEQVPAPAAPKSHGGSGFDGLDLFTILMSGGRGQSSYDWGPTPRRSPQNTWSSGSSRTSGSGSRSSTTRRSSTRSSSGGSSKRAGRTRKRRGR
jgi:type IV secretory pathway VirB10-like protein